MVAVKSKRVLFFPPMQSGPFVLDFLKKNTHDALAYAAELPFHNFVESFRRPATRAVFFQLGHLHVPSFRDVPIMFKLKPIVKPG